jgi:hypothetical protein
MDGVVHVDAKQVVLDLIERKIKFHVLRNFITNERFKENHEESVSKIELLKSHKEEVIQYFDERLGTHDEYHLESFISINPIKK